MANKKYLDLEGLQRFLQKADERYASIQALVYKGVVADVAHLPTVANEAIGNMYTITSGGSGVTTSDFVEGAGKDLQDGENVVAVNTGTDSDPVMKWDILGGVFKITDRLQFVDTMPVSGEDGQVLIYLGETTYTYDAVTPTGEENPSEEGWYELVSGEYVPTSDQTVDNQKTYYERTGEEYVQGVIYQYDDTDNEWKPLSSGDVMVAITTQEIDALFA